MNRMKTQVRMIRMGFMNPLNAAARAASSRFCYEA